MDESQETYQSPVTKQPKRVNESPKKNNQPKTTKAIPSGSKSTKA